MRLEIIDADGHVTETWEQIARHLEEPYRKRPLLTPFFPQDGWDRRLTGTFHDWAGDVKAWHEALDAGGMTLSVLFPTLGLFMPFLRDPDWAAATCRAYNTMLHEELTSRSPRLRGVALLPLQDAVAAVAELQRTVTRYGFVGALLAADGPYLLGHPRFDPIYAAAQDLDVPVCVHASGTDMSTLGVEPFPKFIQAHTVSHAFGQMRQITSMIFEGVPARFPRLRIAYLEAGVGWCRTSCSAWTRSSRSGATWRRRACLGRRASTSRAATSTFPARPRRSCSGLRSTTSAPARSCSPRTSPTGTTATPSRSKSCGTDRT